MPGIGVISNRNARLNRLHPELKEQLAFVMGGNGKVSSTGTLDDACKAAETFRRIGVDIIAISGGDGTAHRTMEILTNVYGSQPLPPILLLPTGTQNMVPHSFGIEGSGLANLMLADLRYRHNVPMRCIRRNLLKVNGHLSFMFGFGVAARFMEAYYKAGETNPKGAAKLLGRILASGVVGSDFSRQMLSPIGVKITANGETSDVKVHTLFCSFVERLPLHFVLFPRCGREEGKFEFVYSSETPTKIAASFPAMMMGSTSHLEGITRLLEHKLTLELDHPEGYTLDGELYDPVSYFEIESGPEINFVVPALSFRAEDENLRYSQCGPWSMRFLL